MSKICHPHSLGNTSENVSSSADGSRNRAALRFPFGGVRCSRSPITCVTAGVCHAQSRDVVCREGVGDFEAEFVTGVAVRVGAVKERGSGCASLRGRAQLGRSKFCGRGAASQADVDAFGVDLGVGAPVAAIQVKKSKSECCMEYKIYSLRAPPALLRSITAGSFSAPRTRISMAGSKYGRTMPPRWKASRTCDWAISTLRRHSFSASMRGRLLDASSEFQSYFDQKIATSAPNSIRWTLADFKSSDGNWLTVAALPIGCASAHCEAPKSECWKSSGPIFTAGANRRPGGR